MTQEEKAKAYDEALDRARELYEKDSVFDSEKTLIRCIFPELQESEDEKIRKGILELVRQSSEVLDKQNQNNMIAWLEKQGTPQNKGEISDGYHTFNELYYYRLLYNAAFFNMLPKEWVHKSKRHNDGEYCFGGGWFIVMANLPTGQISNHYELKDWDLFQIPEKEVADKWDGHTPQDAADRLHKYLLEKQSEQKTAVTDFNAKDWYVSKVDGKIHDMTYNPADKVEPKFKVGDWVVDNRTGVIHYIANIKGTVNGCYYVFGNDKGLLHIDNEEDYHLWTIQDAKDGDILTNGEIILIFKQFEEPSYKQHIIAYIGLDISSNIQVTDDYWQLGVDKVSPATKEQRELLFQKMKEAGYEWDADKKELKKVWQKLTELAKGEDYGKCWKPSIDVDTMVEDM